MKFNSQTKIKRAQCGAYVCNRVTMLLMYTGTHKYSPVTLCGTISMKGK
jgi:hypothetical protein